jgi:hypothetical protein
MVRGVAFGAYVLSIAFGPHPTAPGSVEIPADFFAVHLVCRTPLFGGLGRGG